MAGGLSNNVTSEIQTDSPSAQSIAKQYGTSRKTRHIQLRYLFMQDLIQSGILKITNISGATNTEDVLTRPPQSNLLNRQIQHIEIVASADNQIFSIR